MENRCYGCMKMKRQSVCEHCGFPETEQNDVHQLPLGTLLRDQYVIGKVLGQGGFGITYLGWDRDLHIPVAIKEYFPSSLVNRNTNFSREVTTGKDSDSFQEGRERFLREARTLAKLKKLHNVVQVQGFFQENNTAYIVMEYVEGTTLQAYVKERGGVLTVSETFAILRPVMNALHQVHEEGMIHRDISPDNIMLGSGGTVKLLDFGTARGLDASGNQLTHSTQAVLKHGFAPMEQYATGKAIDRRADEYALCATAWYCLTGSVPPSALDRMMDGASLDWRTVSGLTKNQCAALETGSALRADDRYPGLKELETALFGSDAPAKPTALPVKRLPAVEIPQTAHPAGEEKHREEEKSEEAKPKKKWWIPITAAVIALAVLVGVFTLGGNEKPEKALSTPAANQEPWRDNILMSDQWGIIEWTRDNEKVFGSDYLRKDIQTITFLDTLKDAPADAWDVSETKNGSVMAWTEPSEKSGTLYNLYIAGNGGVCAPSNCEYLFSSYENLSIIDFNTSFHVSSNVTVTSLMFLACTSLETLDISCFDTSNVTDMAGMFSKCEKLTELDLGNLNTSNVRSMASMFRDCKSLTSLDVSSLDTSNVTDMFAMFSECDSLKALDLSNFDTSQVERMDEMFCGCDSLAFLDLSSFDTSRVTSLSNMFYKCPAELNLGEWETDGMQNASFIDYYQFMDSGRLYNGKPWEDLFK